MSISSISGGQSASQLMRPAFRPPSFESLDTNADSSLTLDELKANAPKGTSAADADKRAEALFKAMDADQDGSVTSTEKDTFDTAMADQRQAMAFMTQQMATPSNADVFAQTDTDGDGAVTIEEFGSEDSASEVGSEALQKLFDLIDADGDGSITETESSEFLDTIKSAMEENRPAGGPPPGGPPPGGPPPGGPPPADAAATEDETEDSTTTTLFSAAQTAYKTTQQQSLLEQLVSIFDSAA
ncbi:EF-hand domain-containing protein [Devosia sp. SL43]|uniref:EF-hand domain-containing protein n=1 Tax=Devosia sp. SL43 TaxID=2806348 RepID=UPI001F022E55|nr:EF-hand domain-containing protein [Devosia sp. SL43]UJW85176.1 EF-hand domain-containing protein [Devosia sp. SL43]